MPDENKMKALEKADFEIAETCSTCIFFRQGSRNGWGHCLRIPYNHGKHSGHLRPAGVPVNGICRFYEKDGESLIKRVGSYERFSHSDR